MFSDYFWITELLFVGTSLLLPLCFLYFLYLLVFFMYFLYFFVFFGIFEYIFCIFCFFEKKFLKSRKNGQTIRLFLSRNQKNDPKHIDKCTKMDKHGSCFFFDRRGTFVWKYFSERYSFALLPGWFSFRMNFFLTTGVASVKRVSLHLNDS